MRAQHVLITYDRFGHSVDVCRKKAKDNETGVSVRDNANKTISLNQNGLACCRTGNISQACFAKRDAGGGIHFIFLIFVS